MLGQGGRAVRGLSGSKGGAGRAPQQQGMRFFRFSSDPLRPSSSSVPLSRPHPHPRRTLAPTFSPLSHTASMAPSPPHPPSGCPSPPSTAAPWSTFCTTRPPRPMPSPASPSTGPPSATPSARRLWPSWRPPWRTPGMTGRSPPSSSRGPAPKPSVREATRARAGTRATSAPTACPASTCWTCRPRSGAPLSPWSPWSRGMRWGEGTSCRCAATWPSRRAMPCLARPAPEWVPSTPGTARPPWLAWSASARPAKSGSWPACMGRRKRRPWASSTRSSPCLTWKRRPSPGAGRWGATRRPRCG